MDVSLVSSIAAVGSVVGAVLASLAAFRAAGLAKEALRQAAASENRRARGEATELAQRTLTEYSRVVALADRVSVAFTSLMSWTGNIRSSSHERRTHELEAVGTKLKYLCVTAEAQAADFAAMNKLSLEELSSLSSQLFSDLTQLRVEKEKLRDELNDLRAQNQQHLQQALNKMP